MCQNGRYVEHGIKGLHGFAAERYRESTRFVVRVDPRLAERGVLLEPASVVAKAWDQIEKIGRRATWAPSRVLVTGAGPIGLLAALLGVQRGLDVHVLDHATSGPKPQLVRDLGATYHEGAVADVGPVDIVIECTGVPSVVLDAMRAARASGVVCLTGVSAPGKALPVDIGELNRDLVLGNIVVFGSVNANRAHYDAGARALIKADPRWLDRLFTRRVRLEDWAAGLEKQPGDVKTVLTFDT
jgi:threonine dehydrogenase-like Zn-dependent dehydrogenase